MNNFQQEISEYEMIKFNTLQELVDFINQFNIEQRAVDLLQQYKACGPWDSEESIKNFTDKLLDVIPQCNLCPESRIEQIVWPLSKLKKSII
jgi:hypothetical protein